MVLETNKVLVRCQPDGATTRHHASQLIVQIALGGVVWHTLGRLCREAQHELRQLSQKILRDVVPTNLTSQAMTPHQQLVLLYFQGQVGKV